VTLPHTSTAAALPASESKSGADAGAPAETAPQTEPDARPRVVVPMPAPRYRAGGRWPRGPRPALSVDAHRLVIDLARAGESVTATARRYPHAMNAIAQVWGDPVRALQVIDELLIDRRGGRRGLPADVLAEVLSLSQLCEGRIDDGS
jgi:hypothetical protein